MSKQPKSKHTKMVSPAPTQIVSKPSFSLLELRQEWWLLLLIFAAIFGSFLPSLQNAFVDWDDSGMFLENIDYRGLLWPNIKWMFTTFHYAHYHPITWLTLGLDYEIWGLNPKGYHLTSLIIHSLNGVAFYFLIKELLRLAPNFSIKTNSYFFRFCCAVGALAFALHPLRVESVAWATERRDVLSGFFYILTLIAYLKAQTGETSRRKWLFISLIFFLLSFLSKAWGITLPIVLLLLDFYPLRRFGMTRSVTSQKEPEPPHVGCYNLLIEKIPFFIISIVLAVVAYKGQLQSGIEHENLGLLGKLAISAYGFTFYLWKTLIPLDLSPLYALPQNLNPFELKYLLCGAFVGGFTFFLFLMRRRLPWALIAWLCYGAIVSPVIGLTQKGDQIAADRYTYLCLLPLPVLLSAGLFRLSVTGEKIRSRVHIFLLGISLVALTGLSFLTFQQTKIWKDDFSLWHQAVKVEPNNAIAHNGHGRILMERGKLPEAIADFDLAIQLNPKLVSARSNRGMAYHTQGNLDAALADYTAALKLQGQYQTYNNRGALKETRGDLAGAIADYTLALQLNPKFSIASFNRARVRKQQGDFKGALADYSMAIKYDPYYAEAYLRRGNLLREEGNIKAARQDYEIALKVAPTNWAERTVVEQKLAGIKIRPN